MKFPDTRKLFPWKTAFALLIVLFLTLNSYGTEDPQLLKKIRQLNVRNTKRTDMHNPFSTAGQSGWEAGLPRGWIKATPEDFPDWNNGFLQGWKKEVGPNIYAGILLGVRRYTAWVPETSAFLSMISESFVDQGADRRPFISPYTTSLDLGVTSGRVIQKNWTLGEIIATGPGDGITITNQAQYPIHTTARVFIQPRYTNIYFVYLSVPSEVQNQLLREINVFIRNLKINIEKIPADPVLNCHIPDDKQKFTLEDLLSLTKKTGPGPKPSLSFQEAPAGLNQPSSLTCVPIVDFIE